VHVDRVCCVLCTLVVYGPAVAPRVFHCCPAGRLSGILPRPPCIVCGRCPVSAAALPCPLDAIRLRQVDKALNRPTRLQTTAALPASPPSVSSCSVSDTALYEPSCSRNTPGQSRFVSNHQGAVHSHLAESRQAGPGTTLVPSASRPLITSTLQALSSLAALNLLIATLPTRRSAGDVIHHGIHVQVPRGLGRRRRRRV
jgi:hypothetical protein